MHLESGFRSIFMSVATIEIPSSIKVIDGLLQVHGLEIVRFGRENYLREIQGFHFYELLERIEFPKSGKVIDGSHYCHSLRSVSFARENQIRELCGFHFCIFASGDCNSIISLDCFLIRKLYATYKFACLEGRLIAHQRLLVWQYPGKSSCSTFSRFTDVST
jgi:hypothetical protein